MAIVGLLLAAVMPASAEEPCNQLHCKKLSAIDGDSIKCDGVNLRDMGDGEPFKSGYDAPETRKAKCDAEKALGKKARKRMAELLRTPGLKICDSGEVDAHWKRPLVWARLLDGRTIGSILISEGLAREWTPEYRPDWCN